MPDKLSILEQTTMPRILVFLLNNEKVNRTTLKNSRIGSQDTIYRTIRLAKQEDLIEDTRIDGFGGAVYTTLTPKGRAVAEKLLEIRELLEK